MALSRVASALSPGERPHPESAISAKINTDRLTNVRRPPEAGAYASDLAGTRDEELPDLDRVERIGEFWSYPQSRSFAELLIDCEEDRTLRAVLVGMLRQSS